MTGVFNTCLLQSQRFSSYVPHTAIVEPQNRKHTCGHAKTCWSCDKPMVGSLSYVLGLQRGPVVQYSIDAVGPLPTLVKANHRGVCGANYPAQKFITAVSACCCGPLHIAGACPPRKNAMQRSWILFIRRHGEGMRLVWLSRKQKGQRNRVLRLLVLCVCCPQKKIRPSGSSSFDRNKQQRSSSCEDATRAISSRRERVTIVVRSVTADRSGSM